MNNKVALITGISGQDGSYLAKHLLDNGYIVHGLTRDTSTPLWRHKYLALENLCQLHSISLTDYSDLLNLLIKIKPSEIYHLAGQSSVAESLKEPRATLDFNITTTLNILEAIKNSDTNTRFFNASSSEIFAQTKEPPLTEDSKIGPTSPYGVSKATGHFLTQTYRLQYGLFAVNGILFPHESPLRKDSSFCKKIINESILIKKGEHNKIVLYSLDNERDFGDAQEYVLAMYKSLQVEKPTDYIISSGKSVSIREVVRYVTEKVGIDFDVVSIEKNVTHSQSNERTIIYGDSTKAKELLNWHCHKDIFATIDEMIEFEENKH